MSGIERCRFRDTDDRVHRPAGSAEPLDDDQAGVATGMSQAYSRAWPDLCSDECVAAGTPGTTTPRHSSDNFPRQSRTPVASLGREQAFSAQEIVSHQGSPSDSVFLLVSGVVKVTALSPSGREVILGFRAAGELLGEYSALHGLPRSGNVVGHEAGTLLRISARRFRRCAFTHPEILAAMLAVSGHRLHQSDIHRVSYAAHDVPYRTAATLLDWATRYGVDTQDGVRNPASGQPTGAVSGGRGVREIGR